MGVSDLGDLTLSVGPETTPTEWTGEDTFGSLVAALTSRYGVSSRVLKKR